MGAMSSPGASLAQLIGQQAGKALAGNAPLTVSDTQVRVLGDQVPRGARVDPCADRITFSTASVSFAVEAVPPGNPDMTFRIAGLVDPAVVVPVGATVTVEFINADSDEAHGWVLTTDQPPFAFSARTVPALAGATAGVIGDPTPAGHGARIITFTASAAGTYQYICPMPGHAEMGMHGAFIVRNGK
jgi:rusticyanin